MNASSCLMIFYLFFLKKLLIKKINDFRITKTILIIQRLSMRFHFFVLSSESHLSITSSLCWLLADTLKQATVRSFSVSSSIFAITYSSVKLPYRSLLLPNTKSGIPAKLLFWSSSCICVRASYKFAIFIKICTLIKWIDYEDYDIRISAEFLPGLSKTSLSTQVP